MVTIFLAFLDRSVVVCKMDRPLLRAPRHETLCDRHCSTTPLKGTISKKYM